PVILNNKPMIISVQLLFDLGFRIDNQQLRKVRDIENTNSKLNDYFREVMFIKETINGKYILFVHGISVCTFELSKIGTDGIHHHIASLDISSYIIRKQWRTDY